MLTIQTKRMIFLWATFLSPLSFSLSLFLFSLLFLHHLFIAIPNTMNIEIDFSFQTSRLPREQLSRSHTGRSIARLSDRVCRVAAERHLLIFEGTSLYARTPL